MKRIMIVFVLTIFMHSSWIDAMVVRHENMPILANHTRSVPVQPSSQSPSYASIPTSSTPPVVPGSVRQSFARQSQCLQDVPNMARSCMQGLCNGCDAVGKIVCPADCGAIYPILGAPSRCWNSSTASQQTDAACCFGVTCCVIVCCAIGSN